jgi:asparagine synthase (glutamine-hydrolysing)
MCGIFSLFNTDNYDAKQLALIEQQFNKGKSRGPENSTFLQCFLNTLIIGFHRLAINGLNNKSNQPFFYKDIVLICNGEIYNYKELYKWMDVSPTTDSDCEVIIYLYMTYGIEQTLLMLDGKYAFIIYDFRHKLPQAFIGRDPYGVCPLYKLYNNNNNNNLLNLYGFASELKCLEYLYNRNTTNYYVEQFKPGTYSHFTYGNNNRTEWKPIMQNKPYFLPTFSYLPASAYVPSIHKMIATYLNTAVVKRCKVTDRQVACLLSGGLDSSLVAALASNYFNTAPELPQLETYSIGLENSEDLKYAKIVAEYIGSKHTEIILTEEDFFNAIPEVIKAIESYDTTTVRASIGNYMIGKYIARNSDAKVILNGDGSDELFGGYLYMKNCPDNIEFDKETRRLLEDIHLFDVLRSDKSISSNGLEPRTPFLDKTFVNAVLSISPEIRNHNNFNKPEKYLLRESFSNVENFQNNKGELILPETILWRKKEAFSDGVSNQSRSLFTVLQELIAKHYDATYTTEPHIPSLELEKKYYKSIFDLEFPNCEHIVPYFWMPKYTTASDPSARTLEIYNNV